jgi:hypothetical protein
MSIDSTALSTEARQVFEAALRLPESEREKLADQLYSTLDTSADEEAEKEFEATIALRVAEIENGTAKLLNWEDLQREMQESIDAARKIQAS